MGAQTFRTANAAGVSESIRQLGFLLGAFFMIPAVAMGVLAFAQRDPMIVIPLVLVAGSIGIAGVGTLLATMSVNTTGKDFILAVLFIPLAYPLLLGAVTATAAAIMGGPEALGTFWAGMAWVFGYDVIMLLASYGLYEFIVGA